MWGNNVFGMISEKDWLSIPFDPTRPNDPTDAIFGDEKTDNIIAYLQSIAADMQIPSMAQFHAFDTEAGKALSIPVDTHSIKKGLIKVKKNQSEYMQELLDSGVRKDQMYDYVINDAARLAEMVITRTKVVKCELLSTGNVTINENNLNLTVDYGVKNDQTNFTLDLSESADIISQIQTIIDTAKKKGVQLTGMILAGTTLTKMRRNKSIQKAINGNIGEGATVRSSALRDFLADEFKISNVIENDHVYNASNKLGVDGRPEVVSKRYFPEDKVTFFASSPNGKIGIGLWGNPPEAINPLIQSSGSSVSPYVSISQWTEHDPTVLWIKASALFMPVLYNPSSLYIATITEAEGA